MSVSSKSWKLAMGPGLLEGPPYFIASAQARSVTLARMTEPEDQKPEQAPEPPLKRIEAALEHDVEEARAIEPLVADADTVQQRVRSKLSRALPLLVLVGLGAALIASGVYKQLNLDNLAHQHQAMSEW